MNYISRTCLNAVLAEWAYRENTVVPLLLQSRAPVINPLPKDTQWYRAQIGGQDLASFRVIGEMSWNDLSFGCGELPVACENFAYFSKCPIKLPHQVLPNGETRQQYFDRLISGLRSFIQNNSSNYNLSLVLISTKKTWTIYHYRRQSHSYGFVF